MRIYLHFLLDIAVALSLSFGEARAQEAIRRGDPITLRIDSVRSIAPEERVGFSKSLSVYAVSASSPTASYILYCTKNAPEAGQSYTALDEYVSGDYSWLHLWPVERKSLQQIKGAESKKKGRLYRVIILQNVLPEPHPDLACDIYSEKMKEGTN
jgi:hypothetical protein